MRHGRFVNYVGCKNLQNASHCALQCHKCFWWWKKLQHYTLKEFVIANFLVIAYCEIICYLYNKICFTWTKIHEREVFLRFWKVWHRFMSNIFSWVKQILLDQIRQGLWNTYCFLLMTPDIIKYIMVFAMNSWSTAFTKCVSAN